MKKSILFITSFFLCVFCLKSNAQPSRPEVTWENMEGVTVPIPPQVHPRLYVRSADSAVRIWIKADLLHAVPADKQVVRQLCIFIVIGASEVIFAYYSGHKLCKLVVFPAVRADYRLRQIID